MTIVRQIIVSLLLVAIAGGGFLFYNHLTAESAAPADQSAGARPVGVVVAVAELETVRDRAEAVGTTLASQAIEIVPLASGRIMELAFEPGEAVEPGTILARLDDTIERADLAEARAMAQESNSALERGQRLRASNNIAAATLVELQAAASAAQARVDRAVQRLEDRVVRAPFDGVVGIRRLDLGARVDNNSVITTLDDRREMIVEFSLPEVFYGRVARGLPVAAKSSSFPDRSFDGAVTSVDTRIDITSRSFRVRASLPNPDLLLPAGLFVLIDVTLDEREAVVVPEEAVNMEAGRSIVYVAREDRAERRPIGLGIRTLGHVEVISGLEPGELVVTRGLQRMRDGVPISYDLPQTSEGDPVATPEATQPVDDVAGDVG